MFKYKEENLTTIKDILIKTYNDSTISNSVIEIEEEEEEILDHNFDFNVYKDLQTYEEKMRYIILYDEFYITDILQLKKVFFDDFNNSIEDDSVNALSALIILLNYECMKDNRYFIQIKKFLNKNIPTNNNIMKNIAKLMLHYDFQLPDEYLLSLINELNEMKKKN